MDKELKVTKLCEVCSNQYGLWRAQCPACGTKNVQQAAAIGAKPKPTLARKVRDRGPDECIFCYRRKAKEKCPHCDEPIHRVCRGLHEAPCAAFQVERKKAMEALNANQQRPIHQR